MTSSEHDPRCYMSNGGTICNCRRGQFNARPPSIAPLPDGGEVDDHKVIWLEPKCADQGHEGRQWCQDDAWGKCDDCDAPSVKYIRADIHEAEVRSLSTRLREAEEALEPFAKAADRAAREEASGDWRGILGYGLTFADLRRARALSGLGTAGVES